MKKIIVASSLFILVFFSITSHAQVKESSEKRTVKLSFEDELIRGGVESPDLLLILKSKNPNYGRLLKLRDHFLPELRQTRYEILKGAE